MSSILLILFAAGLTAHGVHELVEANILPPIISPVWDINPKVNADGSFPLLHENGLVGSFMKGLFGYNGNPDLIEIIAYLLYFGIIFILYKKLISRAEEAEEKIPAQQTPQQSRQLGIEMNEAFRPCGSLRLSEADGHADRMH